MIGVVTCWSVKCHRFVQMVPVGSGTTIHPEPHHDIQLTKDGRSGDTVDLVDPYREYYYAAIDIDSWAEERSEGVSRTQNV